LVSTSGFASVGTTTNTNYADATAANGTTYYYLVTASNIAGESPNSNVTSATPTAPAVPKTVTIINCDSPAPGTPISASLNVYLLSDTSRTTLLATTTGGWTTIASSGTNTISMVLAFPGSLSVGQVIAVYVGALNVQSGQISAIV